MLTCLCYTLACSFTLQLCMQLSAMGITNALLRSPVGILPLLPS